MIMGCAVEKPFLQILRFQKKGINKWTLALCVPIKRTTHMYNRFIVRVKGLFLLGMLDATPVIGHAGVLRDLVVQILRMEFKFGNNYSGRAEYGTYFVVEVLRQFWAKCSSRIFHGGWVRPSIPTKTPSPLHHHHMTPSVMAFSVSIQWITLIFDLFTLCLTHCLLECSIGRENHHLPFKGKFFCGCPPPLCSFLLHYLTPFLSPTGSIMQLENRF